MRDGFCVLGLVRAARRVAWAFLKPSGAVVGPFDLFHLICTGLVIYSQAMKVRVRA